MGRKKLLKLRRKLERERETINKKENRKKTAISVVFLVLLVFAAYQINIAMNKNKNIESNKVADVNSGDGDNSQDSSTQSEEPINENSADDANSQDDSAQSEEPTDDDVDLQDDPAVPQDNGANKVVMIETSRGNIRLELFTSDAPKTVENFVKLAGENFYDGTKFHRVISDFMIQGGDPLSKDDNPSDDGTGGPGYKFEDEMNPISLGLNEATIKRYEAGGYEYDYNLSSHKMEVGVLAMANSGPNTNGSQFFIVTESSQPHLDGKHTVFGKVVEGMDVVRSIEQGDVVSKVYVVE